MITLIKNGMIITDRNEFKGDILIEGEKISAIGEHIEADADRIIDAEGKLVMPGGVDQHTHFQLCAMLATKILPVMKLRTRQ